MSGKNQKGKGPKCYYCGKYGHIKRNCRDLNAPIHDVDRKYFKENFGNKHGMHNVAERKCRSSSDSDEIGLVVNHALISNEGKETWITDSGATCHMCNNAGLFIKLDTLE